MNLMDLVGRWPLPLRQRLVTELAQWTTQQVQPLIIAVEQHLTITYFEHDNRIDAATYQAVKFLSIVAEANDQSKAVSYTKFYLDIINSEDFDVKRDYVSWKRPGLLSDSHFSFCHYPFVYDPASKSDILSYENTGEMREQFHDAIFESFFTGGSCPYLVLRVSLCYKSMLQCYATMLVHNACTTQQLHCPTLLKTCSFMHMESAILHTCQVKRVCLCPVANVAVLSADWHSRTRCKLHAKSLGQNLSLRNSLETITALQGT